MMFLFLRWDMLVPSEGNPCRTFGWGSGYQWVQSQHRPGPEKGPMCHVSSCVDKMADQSFTHLRFNPWICCICFGYLKNHHLHWSELQITIKHGRIVYRNESCKKLEQPLPRLKKILCKSSKIGCERGKIIFTQAKGYQSWVCLSIWYKSAETASLVDSMPSSSESFQVVFSFFFGDSSSVRLIQHQFGAMPRAPGASIFCGMSFRLIEHLSWSNYSDLTPKCSWERETYFLEI